MPHAPDGHRRRSVRMPGYDYTRPGAYFITICSYRHERLFGKVVDGLMVLSDAGEIAQACWDEIPAHFPDVDLDAFVVMPNHIHGIVIVVGARHASPVQEPLRHRSGPKPGSIGAIVGSFKSAVTRRYNQLRGIPGAPVWQRNYWEHVVRSERALAAIRQYIGDNPARWSMDRYNSDATARDPRAEELWRLLRGW